MMFDVNILIDANAAKNLGLEKTEMAYCLYDFLSNGCTDNEIMKYIDILYGEDRDDDFMSMLAARFNAFAVHSTPRTSYGKFIKCMLEKDCRSDVYTAITAYLGEWDDDCGRSVKVNDPNRQAG